MTDTGTLTTSTGTTFTRMDESTAEQWAVIGKETAKNQGELPPFKRGQHYFQFRNTGLQNQNVLYVSESYSEPGRMLLDPNLLSEDGTAALNNYAISEDGKWLAYAISSSGSDWQDWHVREVASGTDLPEILHWSKFAGAAFAERSGSPGFYYARYPEPEAGEAYEGANYNQKLYFHSLKTPQEQDALAGGSQLGAVRRFQAQE